MQYIIHTHCKKNKCFTFGMNKLGTHIKVCDVRHLHSASSDCLQCTVQRGQQLLSIMQFPSIWNFYILHFPLSKYLTSRIERCMGPTWGLFGADRTQVGPMLAPWILLSGMVWHQHEIWLIMHMVPPKPLNSIRRQTYAGMKSLKFSRVANIYACYHDDND